MRVSLCRYTAWASSMCLLSDWCANDFRFKLSNILLHAVATLRMYDVRSLSPRGFLLLVRLKSHLEAPCGIVRSTSYIRWVATLSTICLRMKVNMASIWSIRISENLRSGCVTHKHCLNENELPINYFIHREVTHELMSMSQLEYFIDFVLWITVNPSPNVAILRSSKSFEHKKTGPCTMCVWTRTKWTHTWCRDQSWYD